jgi:hypothetical protein
VPKNVLINCVSRFFICSPAMILFCIRQILSSLFLSPAQIRRLFGGCGNKPEVSFFHSTGDATIRKMIRNRAGGDTLLLCSFSDCYIIHMLHLFSWQ